MKVFALTLVLALFSIPARISRAADLPSAKDPAAKMDEITQENHHTDLRSEEMEEKFSVVKAMKTCMKDRNDKKLCSKNVMAECAKSMSKTDCRKAVKTAKK